MNLKMKTNSQKEKQMTNTETRTQIELEKKTNPHGIQTPTSVRGFRENLKKYYFVVPTNTDVLGKQTKKMYSVEDIPITNLSLYMKYGEVKEFGHFMIEDEQFIPLTDISSFNDLWLEDKDEPMIIPKMVMVKDKNDFMDETNQILSFNNFYSNENNFKVYETQEEFLTEGEPRWYSLSSQLVRQFYMMTLGDFSGYGYEEMN